MLAGKQTLFTGEQARRVLTSSMNFLQIGLMSSDRVALNIRTCFWFGVFKKISCTSLRMSSSSSILSHSSSTKCFRFLRFSLLILTNCRIRPGVPTTMCGVFSFSVRSSCVIGRPPKNTEHRICGMYFENRSYSLLIWKASSLVLHITRTDTFAEERAPLENAKSSFCDCSNTPNDTYLTVDRIDLL